MADPAHIWSFFRPGRSCVTVRDADSKPLDYQICEASSPDRLTVLLNAVAEGRIVNQISVPEDEKHWARIALQRMLDVS